MRVLSLFDGISCGMIAFERAGIPVEKYVAYEINQNAIKVSRYNYPQIEQKGNVFDAEYEKGQFDILIGGSPCLFWSISKKNRENTIDGIGYELFLEFVRAKEQSQCKYFLYENNSRIPKTIIYEITKKLGVEPIMIKSELVSAQRRHRLYWTNIPNVTQPKDRNISLIDILTYDDLAVYNGADYVLKKQPLRNNIGRLYKIGHTGTNDNQSTRVYDIHGKSQTIASQAGGGGAKTGLYLWTDGKVYSLNKSAVEKLQTLPQGYLDCVTKDVGISLAGNGWTVDVIAHILSHLPKEYWI